MIDDGDGETIKELSPHGQLVRAFDRPPAPEMASVTDLAFLGDKLWVADLLGSRLHALDRRSGNWESQKLALEPYRIETAGVGERLLIMRVAAPQLFDLTDGRGEPRSSFGTLLKAQEDHALALDGYIARSGNGIVFAGKHLGVIASFSASGALSYVVRTVSPPAPPVVMHQGPRRWLRHSPLLAARSFAANDETLWVLTRRPIGLSLQSVIDLYRASNGGYVKSLLLPEGESWSSMTVGPKALYVASDKRIVAWPQAQVNVDTTGRPILVFLSTTSSKGENDES